MIAKSRESILERTGKTPEELKAEIEASKTASKDVEAKFEESFAKLDEESVAQATGEDLDFDIDAFIKAGLIAKKNLRITSKLYIDMQTLTQRQRLMSEQLVRAKLGNLPQDNVYATAIESAMLAMAITRMNNRRFDIPDPDNASPEHNALREDKLYLFNKLFDSPADFIRTLSFLYANLDMADRLTEPTQKK